jgi:(p)ppGpp synthase/HD superfamily hydrolase
MNYLENAMRLSAMCHAGVKDRNGLPYVSHPLRVASNFLDETYMCVALMHDLLEDTTMTENDLRFVWCFPENIVAAVVAMSRGPKESWRAHIKRCKANKIARQVKLSDLVDNTRRDRDTKPLTPEQERKRRMYFWAIGELENNG